MIHTVVEYIFTFVAAQCHRCQGILLTFKSRNLVHMASFEILHNRICLTCLLRDHMTPLHGVLVEIKPLLLS